MATKFQPSSATKANVTGTGASITVLTASARKGGAILNSSGVVVYLDLSGGTASATSCTVELGVNAYYEIPFGYTGPVTGLWASGDIRTTEFF